jgi:ribosome-binding factor A
MRYKRADRVAALLKEEVSRILLREIKDPELRFVTITKVKLSDDLRHAKLYFSVLPNIDKQRVQKGLDRANRFIRGEIGHRLDLRYVPTLQFFYDDSADYAEHIDSLLKKIR